MLLIHRSNSAFVHFNHKYFKDGHEGKGVYMSDKDNFKSYGKYIYHIEQAPYTPFLDFTTEKNILKIFKQFLRKNDTKRIVSKELNNEYVKSYIEGVASGDYSVTQLMKNIWDCIECNLYEKYNFDLLKYNEKMIEAWKMFLWGSLIVYFDKQFNQDVYFSLDTYNLRIIKIDIDKECN